MSKLINQKKYFALFLVHEISRCWSFNSKEAANERRDLCDARPIAEDPSAVNMAGIWTDKKFLFFLSGTVLQASAFVAFYLRKQRNGANVDEGFEDVSRVRTPISVAALAGKQTALYSTCRFRNRHPVNLASRFQIEDEGPEPEKKILVLGLENSGKSSILAQFTAPHNTNSAIAKVTPTQGFNAVNLINDGVSLKIYERKFIV